MLKKKDKDGKKKNTFLFANEHSMGHKETWRSILNKKVQFLDRLDNYNLIKISQVLPESFSYYGPSYSKMGSYLIFS